MSRDFVGALLQLNAEKQVPREQLLRTIEEAIQAAYRRTEGDEDIHVRIDPDTGKIRVFRARYVVDEVEDPLTELSVDEARGTPRRPRSAISSRPSSWIPSISGGSMRRPQSRSSSSACARPSATSCSISSPAVRAR